LAQSSVPAIRESLSSSASYAFRAKVDRQDQFE
jgi:hypothetical protein